MDELKISIFSPRKDQCDLCLAFANKNPDITQEDYDAHIKKKNDARAAMNDDIENSDYKFVFTMDVETVLLCPVTKASAAYFKSKLTVHNFTIYNCNPGSGYCFLWDETEADLQASVFATLIIKNITILQKYLEKGHTQMKCDSMHSKIERKTRNKEIYLPSAYVLLCEKARSNPEPFKVRYCHHDDFYNYSTLKFYLSI